MSPITADDLPLLDEPLAVELANSWYTGEPGGIIDFLGTTALVQLWFDTASVAAHLLLPSPLADADAVGLLDADELALSAPVGAELGPRRVGNQGG